MQGREESPKRGLTSLFETVETALNNIPYSVSFIVPPGGSPTLEAKCDIVKPLKEYALTKKYGFWHHQHAHRALELEQKILSAKTFDEIVDIISAEIGLYPGHRLQLEKYLNIADKNFKNKTNSYKQNIQSGYYNALNNTLDNVMAFNNPDELRLKTSYKI